MRATAPLAVVGLLLVLLAVAWRVRLTGPALFVLAGEYLVVEVADQVPTVSVVAYAVGLVVLCEILHFHGRLPASGTVDLRVIAERLLHLGVVGVGAAVIAVLVLVVGGLRTLAALEAGLVGMTAAVLLCVIPWVLIRRAGSGTQKG
jgi:hypothetical protein